MGLLDSLLSTDFGGQGSGLLDFLRNSQMQNNQYRPNTTGFPASAGPGGAAPSFPGRTFDSSMFDAAAYEPNQAQPIAVGDYQMPRIGAAPSFMPDPAAIPYSARLAAGVLPADAMTDASTTTATPSRAPLTANPSFLGTDNPGFADRLGAGAANFANAGGPLQALFGGVSGLINGQRTDAQGIQQQNLRAQYASLVPILGPQKAMLAVMNPEAGKTLLGEALTSKEKWGEIGSDSFGNKQFGWINERDQTINSKSVGDESVAGGSSTGFLAPGVKMIDSTLKGADYLKQFSPEVQAAVDNYVQGKSMPTGNPRKGFTQTVKMIAQKYGEDTGQSVDDTTFMARRTMRNQLSSSAPSSLGGQINIGNTAAGHLADLTQKAIELGNWDTGIAPLTHGINTIRGLGTEQAAKMEALKGAAQHYGQEITKFYAGSPGGVAERDRFIESVNGARSPKELAAILATEGELMRSRLDALGGQIKGVLGEEGLKQYPVLRPDGQAALVKVEEGVSKLKGGSGATVVSPAKPALPSGWSVEVR